MSISKNFLKYSKGLLIQKWLLMVHVHVTPKCIKTIWQYSKVTWVYIYIKWSCLQHTKCQNILIYNFLWSLTEKTNHLKLITGLNTLNLTALFIKTRRVLKTSQLNLTKSPWTQGLQNIFQYDKQVLFHRQSSDCTSSWCSFKWWPKNHAIYQNNQ